VFVNRCILCFVFVNFIFIFYFVKFALCVRTYSCTFERALGVVFDLAVVSSTAAPLHSRTALHACVRTCLHKFERMAQHTHAPARVRSNIPMYVRTHSILGLA
jgi:hypothetical protein